MVQTVAAVVAPVHIARVRHESPQRWQAALQRGLANGLEVFQVNDTGERMVTSASKADTLHRSDGRSCTCEAALAGDPVCQHRAVVRFVLGWLAVASTPEPVPVVIVSPVRPMRRPVPKPSGRCAACFGNGERYIDGELVECSQCGGNGMRPGAVGSWTGAA